MAVASIIIRAINATKAAFNEVQAQAASLNKSLNKVGQVFKGLFVAGIAAKAIKELINLSTYSDQLSESGNRIKSVWKGVGQDIADALTPAFLAIGKVIESIGAGVNALIKKIQFASAVAGALFSGAGPSEALKIAEETVAQIKKEQQLRIEANKIAEETAQKEKEAAAAAEKAAQERLKLAEEIAKKENDAIESRMTKEELLAKRREEYTKAIYDEERARIEGNETAALQARERQLDLEKKIGEAQQDIADEEQKRLDEANRAFVEYAKQWKDQEMERLEVAKERIAETHQAEIAALEEQHKVAMENQKALQDAAGEQRKLAIDKDARRAAREEEKQKQRDQRRFENQLKEAERAEQRVLEGRQKELTPAQQAAINARELERAAQGQKEVQDEAQKAILESQEKATEHLASIDEKIQELLALKE